MILGQPAGVSRGQAVKGSNRNALCARRLAALWRFALAASTVKRPPARRSRPPHKAAYLTGGVRLLLFTTRLTA